MRNKGARSRLRERHQYYYANNDMKVYREQEYQPPRTWREDRHLIIMPKEASRRSRMIRPWEKRGTYILRSRRTARWPPSFFGNCGFVFISFLSVSRYE